MGLKRPTKQLIEKYRRQFEHENSAEEEAIKELCKTFPDNKDYKGVLLKSIVINTLYRTQIIAIVKVARRILELDIDARLRQDDPQVVDQIAKLTINGKERRNYSFATKYCSFHKPYSYPIYDSIVDKVLRAYQRQDRFLSGPLGDLRDYRRFNEVLHEFVNFYGLGKPSARELDHFLHGVGKEKFAKRT
jgi:hypothetical protein